MANRLSISASALTSPLNQIYRVSNPSSLHRLTIDTTNIRIKGKFTAGRLMLVRWWLSFARFIKKQANTKARLRPALMVKTDYVGTLGARPSSQDGERFPTINLCILSVFTVARVFGNCLRHFKLAGSIPVGERRFESFPARNHSTNKARSQNRIYRLGVPKGLNDSYCLKKEEMKWQVI